ncbi:MAG: hypothetical protein PHG27_04275 [Massilibacteroides sp.]|nr:hypothetical protein [Massilibacteroides sp.]MDD3063933.1 hypothetical protein [Massilibacteroides sp.]MDD4114801.1 hypothetical protein [Massilibacteroides sp.]MDD4661481.1 hypothetical protein [Massilibacteroides sp.]
MKSKIISLTVSLLLLAGCSNNYKNTNKGTFVSKFEKDNSFVVSGPDAAYLVANTNFYLVLQSGTKKDTSQYMSLILSGDLQVGDSIWIYTNRHKQIKAANYYLK